MCRRPKLDAVALTLVRLSQIAADLPEVARTRHQSAAGRRDGVLALDARMIGRAHSRAVRRPATPFRDPALSVGMEQHIAVKDGCRLRAADPARRRAADPRFLNK